MKTLSVAALASCLLLASMPREARADGERGTRKEEQSYAGREAQAPMLADFRGGCMSDGMATFFLLTFPIWIALLPVGLLVWGVVSLCEPKFPPPSATPSDPPTPKSSKVPR